MENFNRKKHWENIYQTKELNEVSWYQSKPETSLQFIEEYAPLKTSKIIDVGGGDSFLVDNLLDLGYENISVLDISESAIDRAKQRLGERADKVKWIVADASNFKPTEQYDFWHDRAAFHFLTDENDVSNYLKTAHQFLTTQGHLVLGTFSENGPKKCSGIEIKQYSESSMAKRLEEYFEPVKCLNIDHDTPFETVQNFVFCSFKKR